MYPLDVVKTRMQLQVKGPDGEVAYKNMIDCLTKIVKQEGYAIYIIFILF